jgi:hypothetical protein
MLLNDFIEIPPFLQGTTPLVPWLFIRDLHMHILQEISLLDHHYIINDQDIAMTAQWSCNKLW